ncbi:MAG: hypothetical protein MI923_20425 [Phycisphaerales bacterium]|nr:hypothetical protein [Phycisphaerales bacterium]
MRIYRYAASFDKLLTDGVADQLRTMIAAVMPNTNDIGYLYLRSLKIGPAGLTAELDDKSILIAVMRILDAAGGPPGTSTQILANDVARPDSVTPNPLFDFNRAYTVEPGNYQAEALLLEGAHLRNGLERYWYGDDAPLARKNEHLGILAADRDGAALTLSGSIEVEHRF